MVWVNFIQLALGYRWNDVTYSELGYLDLGSVRADMLLPASDDLVDLWGVSARWAW